MPAPSSSVVPERPEQPALRYHGAKFRLADWIIAFFPEHRCYVEPFGGAAGVLLQKPRAYAEVYNDLDGEVVNFFRVLRDPLLRKRLLEQFVLTPYARTEFELAWEFCDEPVEQARRLAIRAQMGFGSAGATKGRTGFRIDTERSGSTAQQHWAQYPEGLAHIGERFSGVLIENRPAIETMLAHDTPQTLHFVDPPYPHSTRVRGKGKERYYRFELSDAEHGELIEAVRGLRGMVVLSTYPNTLYEAKLTGWRAHYTTSRISAGRGGAVRTEVAWLNPACDQVQSQRILFD